MHALAVNLASVPAAFWGWAVLAVLVASGVGFAAGAWHQRGVAARSINRARKSLDELLVLAMRRLDEAQQVCRLFDALPLQKLTDEQMGRLERQRSQLADTLQRLVDRRAAAKEQARLRRAAEPFSIAWTREPADPSGFPDREAFEANLAAMLDACGKSDAPCGLLLVKADRMGQLRSRYDAAGIERLVQKLGSVVCRAVRDADLVCRIGFDAFAVLFPDVDGDEGSRLAQAVRSSVRHYHFRVTEHGEEVLVTASFGYSACHPADNADLVMNRAGDALAKSQKRGRNQLTLHDGQRAAACVGA